MVMRVKNVTDSAGVKWNVYVSAPSLLQKWYHSEYKVVINSFKTCKYQLGPLTMQ